MLELCNIFQFILARCYLQLKVLVIQLWLLTVYVYIVIQDLTGTVF